jgi:hypothetical protein
MNIIVPDRSKKELLNKLEDHVDLVILKLNLIYN